METFPELNTPRLKLRKIQVEDIPALVKYANNKKISDHIINIPHPYEEPQAVFRISYVVQGFKSKSRYVFAIVLKAREELIGEISLHLDQADTAQLGYWVGEPFWGQGLATEAIGAVLKFGFVQLNLHQVYASCHVENKASEIVLLKNGMVRLDENGRVILYALTRQEQV